MKKYLIFDLDGTLIRSNGRISKLISKYLAEHYNKDPEETRYFFSTTKGQALSVQLATYLQRSPEEIQTITKAIYKEINALEQGQFFPGVAEIIKNLAKSYQLLLSTGNSTSYAIENLKKGNILEYFQMVLGSEHISKSPDHIAIFKEKTENPDFEKQAIFIGDGENDRIIAQTCGIDFIHIDEHGDSTYADKYHISSVADIEPILAQICREN